MLKLRSVASLESTSEMSDRVQLDCQLRIDCDEIVVEMTRNLELIFRWRVLMNSAKWGFQSDTAFM